MSTELITRDAVLAALSEHIGANAGISANGLSVAVAGLYATKGTERALRKVIEELRRDGHHVCGEPQNGYYMAATAEELDRTCVFLHDRAMTSLTQVARMKKVSVPDLRGQLRLPHQ